MNRQENSQKIIEMNDFQNETGVQDNQTFFHLLTVDIPTEIHQFMHLPPPTATTQMNISQTDQTDQQDVSQQKTEMKLSREELIKHQNESKTRSDNSMKNTCYYLYWLLLNLNSSTEITLNSNKRVRSQNDRSKHFSCSSIKVNDITIFEPETEYVICEDQERKFQTIKFDDENQSPVKTTSSKKKHSTDENCRIQQHILVKIINNHLKLYNFEIPCFVKRSSRNHVSFLHFTHYFDIDDNGNLVIIEFLQRQFDQFCEILKSVFSFFLDKQTGLTKQLVISNEAAKDSCGLMQTQENIIISRERFLQIVWYIRKNECSLSDIFIVQPYSFNQTETKENEGK